MEAAIQRFDMSLLDIRDSILVKHVVAEDYMQ